MPNSPRYTTISVLKTDKMKLDFVRAKRSQPLSVILGELIEQEYERLFGEKEVVYADTCLWTLHADGYYETQCGQAYTAFAEGLDENHYRYCPSCGGTIVSASEVLAQMEVVYIDAMEPSNSVPIIGYIE